jgi:hypothetical protein
MAKWINSALVCRPSVSIICYLWTGWRLASGAPRPAQRYRMAAVHFQLPDRDEPVQLTVPGAQGGGIERHLDSPER